jgi:hypothetical protein
MACKRHPKIRIEMISLPKDAHDQVRISKVMRDGQGELVSS